MNGEFNPLARFLEAMGIDEIKAMNALQDEGIVSDNAVMAMDVAPADCERAIEHLTKLFEPK